MRLDRLVRRTEPARVDHLGQLSPWPAGGGPGRGGSRLGGPAQGDDADDAAVVGDRERLVDVLVALRRDAEEQRRPGPRRPRSAASAAPPCRCRCPSTAPASGPRPCRPSPCPARRSGAGRTPSSEQHSTSTGALLTPSSQASGSSSGSVVAAQNAARCAGSLSTTKSQPWLKPALGRPGGVAQDRLQALGRDRVVGVVAAHHPAASDDVGELHGPHSPTGAGGASPRWLTGSRTPRTRGRWHGP